MHEGMLEELKVELDGTGNIKDETEGTTAYKTSIDGFFATGDIRRGQSLVVCQLEKAVNVLVLLMNS